MYRRIYRERSQSFIQMMLTIIFSLFFPFRCLPWAMHVSHLLIVLCWLCLTIYTNFRISWGQLRKCINEHTWFLCAHKIALGGSGRCLTMHVKLMVEPMSIYKSGPPKIVVTGSMHKRKCEHIFHHRHRHRQRQQTEKNEIKKNEKSDLNVKMNLCTIMMAT